MDGLSYRAADSLSNTNASLRLNILVMGDVNGDGCVDDVDLLLVLFSFGATGSLMTVQWMMPIY